MKRSTKWYRKNEAETLKSIGLIPSPNSGSGWIFKSDGYNDYIQAELKSTDAQSYRIQKYDLFKLEHEASKAHKLPLFVLQFLDSNELYFIIKPEYLQELAQYIEIGKNSTIQPSEEYINIKDIKQKKVKQIKSSSNSKQLYREEQESRYKKERSAL